MNLWICLLHVSYSCRTLVEVKAFICWGFFFPFSVLIRFVFCDLWDFAYSVAVEFQFEICCELNKTFTSFFFIFTYSKNIYWTTKDLRNNRLTLSGRRASWYWFQVFEVNHNDNSVEEQFCNAKVNKLICKWIYSVSIQTTALKFLVNPVASPNPGSVWICRAPEWMVGLVLLEVVRTFSGSKWWCIFKLV